MASYTTNLNLKKPAGSENVAIGDINNNMDAIDTAYGTLNSKIIPKYYNTEALTTVYNDVVANKVVQFSGSATFAAALTNNNCNNVINGTFTLNENAGVVEGIAYATGASAIFIMRIGSTGAISNLKKASLTSL